MSKRLIAYDGREVVLPDRQRLHVAYFHPEVLTDEKKLELTVSEPELVGMGATEDTRVFYRFFPDTPVTKKFLAVVVRLLDGKGFIVTAYFTDRVKRKIIWRRTS